MREHTLMPLRACLTAIVASVVFGTGAANAETRESSSLRGDDTNRLGHSVALATLRLLPLRSWSVPSDRFELAQVPRNKQFRRRANGRHLIHPKLLGAFAGVAVGMYAGGRIGAAVEGKQGNYDSPGLKGFLIGAPIGGVIGGVIGAKLVK